MMTFAQYLLSKVAEESVEFTKELLKGQQQGLYSSHRGQRNIDYIRDEFIDIYARASLLEICSELKTSHGPSFELLPMRLDMTEENILSVERSIAKMCHYALMAFNNRQLELTCAEHNFVEERALIYKEILEIEALGK